MNPSLTANRPTAGRRSFASEDAWIDWDSESIFANHAAIRVQDARFCRAVRKAHPQFAPPVPKRVRDMITVTSPPKRPRTTIGDPRSDGIIAEVAAKHGFAVPELQSRRRARDLVAAKHEVFYRLSKETSMSLPAIGKKLGGFDHTTIMHGIRKHEERMRAGQG